MGIVALLEACDITNNGRHLAGRHLQFYVRDFTKNWKSGLNREKW